MDHVSLYKNSENLRYVTAFHASLIIFQALYSLTVKKMMNETTNKLQRELRSLYALAIINIVFGGLAMAIGVSTSVPNIFTLIATKELMSSQTLLTIIGFIAFGVSLRWLISSAEILNEATDIKDVYEGKRENVTDEVLTGLIVRMMSYYRQNKATIKKLQVVSAVGGICFLISGTFALANTLPSLTMEPPLWITAFKVLGIAMNFGIGMAGLLITYFFGKYSSTWDYRLKTSEDAEKELEKQLEDN